MRKLLALFLVPVFFAPLQIDSSEKNVKDASSQVKYQLTQTLTNQILDYTSIPKNPITMAKVVVYQDQNLTEMIGTIPPKTTLDISHMTINNNLKPVFELADGSFILASQQEIFSDLVLSEDAYQADFWLKPGFSVYQQPYLIGTSAVTTLLEPYTKVHVIKKAKTFSGVYYKISDYGWVSAEFLSNTDNRMEKVQQLLDSQYQHSKISVSVKQLSTKLSAGVNQEQMMYSASISKLPLLYYVQHLLDEGKISPEDKLKYVAEVNSFKGAFDPSGAGSISKVADEKDYSVEQLLKAISQESDNVATNILAYYIADQYGKEYQEFMAAYPGWDMDHRNLSAETAANLMVAIYEQNGQIIDYLSHTRFDDQRISKDIDVQVAHKTGDAYDFRHDVAIVYSEEPFVLSIFTENTSYDDISRIAKEIYTILK